MTNHKDQMDEPSDHFDQSSKGGSLADGTGFHHGIDLSGGESPNKGSISSSLHQSPAIGMPFMNPKSLTSDTQYLFLRKKEAESGIVTPL